MTDWDAPDYDANFRIITRYGDGLLAVLAATPGERVLDAGCGPGDHVALLRAAGVAADGVDGSAEMIRLARSTHPGLPFEVADLRHYDGGRRYDAVYSNATLHWIPEASAVAAALAGALRPGGRLVAELGGAGNVAAIRAAADTVRTAAGLPPAAERWYFPTVGEYAMVLQDAGFEVTTAALFDRPTEFPGPDGMDRWLRMFGRHLLDGFPDVPAATAAVADAVRPQLWHDDAWWVDYRRLRITATHP